MCPVGVSNRVRRGALALFLAAPLIAGAVDARSARGIRDNATTANATTDDATTNDHREIAGVLRDGEYTLALELRRATWHPNAPSELAVDVPAFAEVGRAASIPGPLIRVPAGTRLRITIRNDLAERATVHGLHDHEGARDSVVLAPNESREVRFVAQRVGMFAYFARTSTTPTIFGRRDDSQLMAAFIVDPAGTDPRAANERERVMVITAWDDSVPNPSRPTARGRCMRSTGCRGPSRNGSCTTRVTRPAGACSISASTDIRCTYTARIVACGRGARRSLTPRSTPRRVSWSRSSSSRAQP